MAGPNVGASGVVLKYGAREANVVVAWTDNSASTGWWYEGSGLARHVRLVVAPAAAQLRPFGVAAPAVVARASVRARGRADQGHTGAAVVSPSADVSVGQIGVANIRLTFELVGADGVVAGWVTVEKKAVASGDIATVAAPPMHLDAAELWSVARPHLYTLVTTLSVGSSGEFDCVNTTVGVRGIEWDPRDGLHLNGYRTKMRGFCSLDLGCDFDHRSPCPVSPPPHALCFGVHICRMLIVACTPVCLCCDYAVIVLWMCGGCDCAVTDRGLHSDGMLNLRLRQP